MPASAQTLATPPDYEHLVGERRIHSSLYTSDAVFCDEMQRIFHDGWFFVCHASEVAKHGNFLRRNIGGEPLLVVRSHDEVNVFVNRCAHRGNMLCHEPKGSARSLVCKYHGWAYNLDGALVDTPSPTGAPESPSATGLAKLPRVEEYRGFYFASFKEDGEPFSAYLGAGAKMIDRYVEMSPVGQIRFDRGWVAHRMKTNWKAMFENNVDGYHVPYVHPSFAQVIHSNYDQGGFVQDYSGPPAESRDWGGGHVELDFAPTYTKRMEWFNSSGGRWPEYVEAMLATYGEEAGNRKLIDGPPHALIFPNLFLAEGNMVIIEPISASECINWHTPLQIEGASDSMNTRIVRQSEAALGPAAFLLADDAIIAERTQEALAGDGEWLDIGWGFDRERTEGDAIVGHISDEVASRGFWKQYRSVMAREADGARASQNN